MLRFPTLAVLALQAALAAYQLSTGRLDPLTLGLASASLVGLAVLSSPIATYLPVFSSLHRAKGLSQRQLSLYYASLGFLACLQGALFEQIFPWVVDTFLAIVGILNPEGDPLQTIPGGFRALFSPRTQWLLVAQVVLASLSHGVKERGHRSGPRAALARIYHHHTLKYTLRRQERTFGLICFGSGVALNYYLSLLFIVLLLLRRWRGGQAAEAWIQRQASEEVGTPGSFRKLAYHLFASTVYASAFWLPIADTRRPLDVLLIVFLLSPFVIAVLLEPAVHRGARSARAARAWLRLFATACWLAMAALQLYDVEANPLVRVLLKGIPPIPEEYFEGLVDFIQVVLGAMFVYQAVFLLRFAERLDRRTGDPILQLRLQKLNVFLLSLCFRAACLLFIFRSLPVSSDDFSVSLLRFILGYIVALVLSAFIKTQGSEKELEELAVLHSQAELAQSGERWGDQLRRELRFRERFNALFLLGLTAGVWLTGHPVLRWSSLPALLMTAATYVMALAEERAKARKILALDLGPERALERALGRLEARWKDWIEAKKRPSLRRSKNSPTDQRED